MEDCGGRAGCEKFCGALARVGSFDAGVVDWLVAAHQAFPLRLRLPRGCSHGRACAARPRGHPRAVVLAGL
eukprot:10722363-Alexandrium_andersonii.AAC.1